MLRVMRYDSAEAIPHDLEAQIRCLLNAEWPGDDTTGAAQPLIDEKFHPVYFVLIERDHVLSYTRTIWATVSHLGRRFKLYGLGDVVTRPESRRRGYGRWIVDEATSHMKSDPAADAAVLLTEAKLEALYEPCGWRRIRGLRVATSDSDRGGSGEPFVMMLFLSPQALSAQACFPTETLVLPGDEW